MCSIYLSDGVLDVTRRFAAAPYAEALTEFLLALSTLILSLTLSGAPRWRVWAPCFRSWLADYAVSIAVVCVALATALLSHHGPVQVQRLPLAAGFGPSCWLNHSEVPSSPEDPPAPVRATPECTHIGMSDDRSLSMLLRRPWLAWEVPTSAHSSSDLLKLWALALCSAVPITFFFYMECASPPVEAPHPRRRTLHFGISCQLEHVWPD